MPNPNQTRLDRRLKDSLRVLRARIDAWRGAPAIKRKFLEEHGYPLNLKAPRTWNEKMQWRKIYDRNPLFPVISDKIAMRDFARNLLDPADHWVVPPYLHTARTASELDIAALPDDVILKPNHGSGWVIRLFRDVPRDIEKIQGKLRYWLDRRFGTPPVLNEQFYWPIPRMIAVEPMLLDDQRSRPAEIKLHLFDGRIRFVTSTAPGDRIEGVGVLDEDWQLLPFAIHMPGLTEPPPRPELFDDMCRIARRVGAGFDYVRVDFLYADTRMLMQEMSVTHVAGYGPVTPVEYDRVIGDWWTLPGR